MQTSSSSSSRVVASAFPDAGRKINELTKTYVYAGIVPVPVPKTASETDDSRPILLFCRRSTPLRCQLSLRCMQPDTSSPTFFEIQHNAPTVQPSPELIIFDVSVRWGRFCVTKWKPYVTASLWDGPLSESDLVHRFC